MFDRRHAIDGRAGQFEPNERVLVDDSSGGRRHSDTEPRMKRQRLSGVSILMSVKIDSRERLRNLRLMLDYYESFYEDYELVVVEQDNESRIPCEIVDRPQVRHHFIASDDVHWKTRNHNVAARLSRGEFLLMSDCDIFVHPEAMTQALRRVREGGHFVQLFNGVLVQIASNYVDGGMRFPDAVDVLRYFPRTYQQEPSRFRDERMQPLYGNHNYLATGGATLCRRDAFHLVGGWNENFVSFGFEDQEFFERVTKLDGPPERIEGYNAYHLEHPRLDDSVYNNFYRSNEAEFRRVCAMSREALRDYVNKGFRTIRFTHDGAFMLTASADRWGWQKTSCERRDLSCATILLLMSAHTAGTANPWPRAIASYLEDNFEKYDVLAVEMQSYAYRFFGSKKYLRYHRLEDIDPQDQKTAVQAVLPLVKRQHALVVDIASPSSIDRFFDTLDEILDHQNAAKILPSRSLLESKPAVASSHGRP
ncbi:MAG: hypothetical protein DWQ08_13190 [Proteobacteria bacterium]|nr:MAG: hypothetical protein DWQ08_13190 [Pseudomonadota bacterium]